MSELESKLPGASGHIRLGGKVYLVPQPTDKDLETIRQSIGLYALKRRKSWLSKLVNDPDWGRLTEAQQNALIAQGAAGTRHVGSETVADIDPAEMVAILSTPEAVRFAVWLLVRKEMPGVSKEVDIDPYVTEENSETVFLEVMQASGMTDLGN